MAHFVHTHRTSCRRGWSRGFGALNSNPHSCIYFRLSVFQYSLLLIHFHDWPNWCLHCTKVGHKTYPILWRSTFEIDTAQSRSVTEIERSVTSRYHGSTKDDISLPSLHQYDMRLPYFTSPLYGVREHNTKLETE